MVETQKERTRRLNALAVRRYYNKHKEARRERTNHLAREWRKRNLEKERHYDVKKRYGITISQYNEILAAQNNMCAICSVHVSELKRSLAVDHCHETKIVRGLLCTNCNSGIGNLRDDPKLLVKALEYLNKGNTNG